MVHVYGIKNCDSVKKALKFFQAHQIEYDLFDFKQEPLPCQKIEEWLQHTSIEKLFNARSTTYRTLKLKEKNLDAEQKATWLCRENMLIKRPVVEYGSQLLVGYNEDDYKKIFLT